MQCSREKAVLGAVSLLLTFSMGAAYAGEKTLEFQLVTKFLEAQTLNAANMDDQTITQAKAFGVAVFKDGRIGTKDFIISIDEHKGAGTALGYSTYNFEDGSVTARFSGTFGPKSDHGDYKIVSGTGAYAGATGVGTYDGIANPFKGSGLYKIRLQIKTP